MIAYVICMVHKRAFNFIEPLEVYIDDELKAKEAQAKYNRNKPKYAHAEIRKYLVKK